MLLMIEGGIGMKEKGAVKLGFLIFLPNAHPASNCLANWSRSDEFAGFPILLIDSLE